MGWLVGAVVAALLVHLGVGVVRRPQRGVLALAALLPFNGLLLVVPHPPIVEGWKEMLVLAVLAATFVAPASARGEPRSRLPTWIWPAGVWLGLSAISGAVVGGTQAAQGIKIGFFYALVFWAMWRCPFSARDRDRFVSILMATGVVTATVGLWQLVIGPDALVGLGYEYNTTVRTSSGVLRTFSTFDQPFPFALFLMVVLLVAVPIALGQPRRPRNALFLAATPVVLAGMASSTVRSALLGTAVGLAFLTVHRHRNLIRVVPVVVAVGVLTLSGSTLSALTSGDSLTERTTGWDQVSDLITTHPLGVGIGATGSVAEKTAELTGSTEGLVSLRWDSPYQPDNQYVKTLLELGPLGLWAVVMLLVAMFLAARFASGRREPERGADAELASGIAASVLAIAAAGFVATIFEIFPIDAYFWMFAGVIATLPASPARTAPSSIARHASTRGWPARGGRAQIGVRRATVFGSTDSGTRA